MRKKFLNINKAVRLQESIALFTNVKDLDKALEEFSKDNFVLSNSNNSEDVHPDSDEFLTALEQYYKALKVMNRILIDNPKRAKIEDLFGKKLQLTDDLSGESYPNIHDVDFSKREQLVPVKLLDDYTVLACLPDDEDNTFAFDLDLFLEYTELVQ